MADQLAIPGLERTTKPRRHAGPWVNPTCLYSAREGVVCGAPATAFPFRCRCAPTRWRRVHPPGKCLGALETVPTCAKHAGQLPGPSRAARG